MTHLEPRTCDASLVRAFEVLGKRWNGMILSVLANDTAAFSELRRALGSISDSMLADRLAELVASGLVERSVDAGPPVSVSYALTDGGRAVVPALEMLAGWASTSLTPRSSAASAAETGAPQHR